jgi:hypothetical protein
MENYVDDWWHFTYHFIANGNESVSFASQKMLIGDFKWNLPGNINTESNNISKKKIDIFTMKAIYLYTIKLST